MSPLDALRSIVTVSQANNKNDGITGYLIFDRTCFLQILEGEKAQVYSTFRRIEADPRHRDVVVMGAREVPARLFPNWTMAGAVRTLDQDEIFMRYGIGKTIVPSRLKADTVVALAQDLLEFHAETKARASA
ncbi:hypothetical protein AXW83_15185 [Bosea sp. PAMC 26642]|nr:hypothetical protein AXW83_15185 [Bosea sp. PAMC 26642]